MTKELNSVASHSSGEQPGVIIVGAGTYGKVTLDILRLMGKRIIGFLDDNKNGETFFDLPVLGECGDYKRFPDAAFVVTLGDLYIRERVVKMMQGASWFTPIHPQTTISTLGVKIGDGSVVMAGAIVNPDAKIGRHCAINTNSVIEHDNVIGDFSHISVGAQLAGRVTVGSRVWVGIGATVINDVSICDDCVIGAGAVVVRNITEPGVYVGVPARRIK